MKISFENTYHAYYYDYFAFYKNIFEEFLKLYFIIYECYTQKKDNTNYLYCISSIRYDKKVENMHDIMQRKNNALYKYFLQQDKIKINRPYIQNKLKNTKIYLESRLYLPKYHHYPISGYALQFSIYSQQKNNFDNMYINTTTIRIPYDSIKSKINTKIFKIDYKTMKQKMYENGIIQELIEKVYSPKRLLYLLNTYNYDIATDEYVNNTFV